MKSIIKVFISVILIVSLTASMLVSCSSKKKGNKDDTKTPPSYQSTPSTGSPSSGNPSSGSPSSGNPSSGNPSATDKGVLGFDKIPKPDDPKEVDKILNNTLADILAKQNGGKKKITGQMSSYDVAYYCYYATDSEGNIFYANKLNQSQPLSVQLGRTDLEGLNAAVAGSLYGKNIQDYLYNTSTVDHVQEGDIVSVSYFLLNETTLSATEHRNEYHVVTPGDPLSNALLSENAQVGIELASMHSFVQEGTPMSYFSVMVESILLKKNDRKVEDGDSVCVSYTIEFDASALLDDYSGTYIIPDDLKHKNITVHGNIARFTVSYDTMYANSGSGIEAPTFSNWLVGKSVDSLYTNFAEENVTLSNGKSVDLVYSDVKIHWTNNTYNAPIVFNYTPYPETYDQEKGNKMTEKNTYGKTIELNGVELTYYVFPVFYDDIGELDARFILKNYSELAGLKIAAETYAFDSLNQGYKNGDKTLAEYVTDINSQIKEYYTAKTAETTALQALRVAQKALACFVGDGESYQDLQTKFNNARAIYDNANSEAILTEARLNTLIFEALSCTGEAISVEAALVNDFLAFLEKDIFK